MRKMDKKGVEITLNFVVIAAIVLIALIVAVLFFTGAADRLFTTQTQVTQEQLQREIALVKGVCETHCMAKLEKAYDAPLASETLRNSGYQNCEAVLGGSFYDMCEMSCQPEGTGPGAHCTGLKKDSCEDTEGCNWLG